MTDDELETRILDLFANAPHDARLAALRDLIASTGRKPSAAAIGPYKATLTIRRAAARLGCSTRLTYKLFDRGELHGYRAGSRVLIFVEAIDRYIAARANVKPLDPSTADRTASSSAQLPRSQLNRRNRRSGASAEPFQFFPPRRR